MKLNDKCLDIVRCCSMIDPLNMNKFRITWLDFFGVMVDIAFMSIRPLLFWVVWNYGVAENTNISRLDLLQVISIIVIFHILVSYVPLHMFKPTDSE